MTPQNAVLIYILIWWVTLFAVLPFGAERDAAPAPGHDRGAPRKAGLKAKLVATSLIALALLGVLELLVRLDIVRWHDWFAPVGGP